MGLHRAQRVIHLDVVTAVCALLQVQCLEGQADDGVGICPQCPVAACIVGVWAVGEPWRVETGDLPFLGVEGEKAAIVPSSLSDAGVGRESNDRLHLQRRVSQPRVQPLDQALLVCHGPVKLLLTVLGDDEL